GTDAQALGGAHGGLTRDGWGRPSRSVHARPTRHVGDSLTVTGFLQRVGPALIRSGDVPRTRPTTPRSAAAETGFSALPLRLIAARGGVGIELYEAQPFGPLTLSELSWSLPGLSFPLDL